MPTRRHPAEAARRQSRRRADPRLERRVRRRPGGIQPRDRVRGAARHRGVLPASEDLRHRRRRGRALAGPPGELQPRGSRARPRRPPREVLRARGGPLRLQPRAASGDHLRTPGPDRRCADLASRPARVPQRPHLLQPRGPATDPRPIPLRAQRGGLPLPGAGGDAPHARQPVHAGQPEAPHLREDAEAEPRGSPDAPRPGRRWGGRNQHLAGSAAARARDRRRPGGPGGGGCERHDRARQRAGACPLRAERQRRRAAPARRGAVLSARRAAPADRAGARGAPAGRGGERRAAGPRRADPILRRAGHAAARGRQPAARGGDHLHGRHSLRAAPRRARAIARRAGDGLRGAAVGQRGAPDHQRGAAIDRRGARDDQRRAAVLQRGDGDHERGAAVDQRGDAHDERPAARPDGRAEPRQHLPRVHRRQHGRGGRRPRREPGRRDLEPQGRGPLGPARRRGAGEALPESRHRPTRRGAEDAAARVPGRERRPAPAGARRAQPAREGHQMRRDARRRASRRVPVTPRFGRSGSPPP